MSWPSILSTSMHDDKYYEALDDFDAEIRNLNQQYQKEEEEDYDKYYTSRFTA